MKSLTFKALRVANTTRLPLFKNAKGMICHNEDGSDWSLNDWLTALVGEVGELANNLKKLKRGDFYWEEIKEAIGKEIADSLIYLDLIAFRAGFDLDKITILKFNEVSRRVGANVFLTFENEVVSGEFGETPVGITPKRHEELLQAERKLQALEAFGVDNWEGYGEAMESNLLEAPNGILVTSDSAGRGK